MKDITKKAMFAKNSPTNRWLQNIVQEEMDANTDTDTDRQQGPMESLYQFCRGAEELVRAFWLATLCRQSVWKVASIQEEKTYGKVSGEEIGRCCRG